MTRWRSIGTILRVATILALWSTLGTRPLEACNDYWCDRCTIGGQEYNCCKMNGGTNMNYCEVSWDGDFCEASIPCEHG
jgi:hypothetical protein